MRVSIVAFILSFCFLGCGSSDSSFDPVTPSGGGDTPRPDECAADSPCALMPGVTASGYIGEEGDVDPYQFQVTLQPGESAPIIQVVVSNDATVSPVQFEVALFGPTVDEQRMPVESAALTNQRSPSNRGRQRVEIQLPATLNGNVGNFQLEVRDVGSDNKDDNNPYFIDLTFIPSSDMQEPNDEPEQATALSSGSAVTGKIDTQGDQDWFRISGQEGNRFRISATAPGVSDMRFTWSLFDPTGANRIAQSTEPSGADAIWPTDMRTIPSSDGGGDFLLLVEAADPLLADELRSYTLQVDELTEPDQLEVLNRNDVTDSATPLTTGQRVDGFVATTGDFDWFAIEVNGASEQNPRILTAEVSYPPDSGSNPPFVSTEVELQLTVFLPDGQTLVCEQRDGDGCKAARFVRDSTDPNSPVKLATAHPVTSNGRYLVLVQDFQGNDIEDSIPYTVELGVYDEPDSMEDYRGGGRDDAIEIVAETSTTGSTIRFPWIEGYISYADDVDWYRFEIPSAEDALLGMNEAVQNGDWLVQIELQVQGPTPVETNAFFFGQGRNYNGFGQSCRSQSNGPDLCQFPDEDNGVQVDFSTTLDPPMGGDDCFVVFREVTEDGPHYWRISDLDRDDFDLSAAGQYRFRMTVTAGCPQTSACMEKHFFGDTDLCGRP